MVAELSRKIDAQTRVKQVSAVSHTILVVMPVYNEGAMAARLEGSVEPCRFQTKVVRLELAIAVSQEIG